VAKLLKFKNGSRYTFLIAKKIKKCYHVCIQKMLIRTFGEHFNYLRLFVFELQNWRVIGIYLIYKIVIVEILKCKIIHN